MFDSDDGRSVEIESAVEADESDEEPSSFAVVKGIGGGLGVGLPFGLILGRAWRRSDIFVVVVRVVLCWKVGGRWSLAIICSMLCARTFLDVWFEDHQHDGVTTRWLNVIARLTRQVNWGEAQCSRCQG